MTLQPLAPDWLSHLATAKPMGTRNRKRAPSMSSKKRKLVLAERNVPRLLGTRFHSRLYCGVREGRVRGGAGEELQGCEAYFLDIE